MPEQVSMQSLPVLPLHSSLWDLAITRDFLGNARQSGLPLEWICQSNFLREDTSLAPCGSWWDLAITRDLKGISVIIHSKLPFFSKPPDLFAYSRKLHVITYLYNNSLGNSTFLKKDTILCCWELIIASDD